jgi:glycosyltransferase involved in cell wall biosynthesis
MIDTPLVDVVIPVHNRADRVVEAIGSVLTQEGPSFHIHVVDDGSTDSTAAAVQKLAEGDDRLSLHRQANAGPSAARNRGIADCAGRLLTFLDSDDLMTDGRLAFQVDHLAAHPQIDAVVGTERIEIGSGVAPPENVQAQIAKSGPKRYWQSVMTARSIIEAVGGYDESLRYAEDLDLAIRMRLNGLRVDYVERELVVRRILGDNLSYGDTNHQMVLLDLLKQRTSSSQDDR